MSVGALVSAVADAVHDLTGSLAGLVGSPLSGPLLWWAPVLAGLVTLISPASVMDKSLDELRLVFTCPNLLGFVFLSFSLFSAVFYYVFFNFLLGQIIDFSYFYVSIKLVLCLHKRK